MEKKKAKREAKWVLDYLEMVGPEVKWEKRNVVAAFKQGLKLGKAIGKGGKGNE